MTSKEEILTLLLKTPLSTKELSQLTGYTESGIRGRISSLRKDGYTIKSTATTSKKYILTIISDYSKFINWLEETNNYNVLLNYDDIAKALDISLDDVKDIMYKVHKNGALHQHTNTIVAIRRKL